MRVAPPVSLSPEERVALERRAARRRSDGEESLRARLVLAAAEGRTDQEIGALLRIHRRTVARWRERFRVRRVAGLDAGPRIAPRPGGLSDATRREVIRAGREIAPGAPPSLRRVAQRWGVSHTTVRRLWHRFGIDGRVHPDVPLRADPRPRLVPAAPTGLYLRPPDRASAFLLAPGAPGSVGADPELLGDRPRMPPPPNALVPEVSRRPDADARTRELLRFLAEIDRELGPERPAEVMVFAPGLAVSPALHRWAFGRPNLRLRWLDDERRWSEWTQTALAGWARHGSPRTRGRGETARSIARFLASFPAASAPFEWVASAGELTRGESGVRLRHQLSATGHPGFKAPFRSPGSSGAPPEAHTRAMARVIVRRCLRLRRGELLAIDSWSGTLEAANALALEAWRVGARPMLLVRDEPTYWAAVQETAPDHLARPGDHVRAAVERSDALVSFFGPSDRERFHALPFRTRHRLGTYTEELARAAARHKVRAVQMALGRISEASARMYAVDLEGWRREVIEATTVDPRELRRRGTALATRLRSGRSVEISHPNGTRLRLGLRGRRPQLVDGIVDRPRDEAGWSWTTLPAGVVNVALDEHRADGFLRSNVANTVGVSDTVGEFVGGRWTFADGRLSRFSYERGQDLFAQSYERAGAGRDRPGVLSIGLNERIETAPLLMDQAAGTLTLQIGRNSHVGGTNRAGWWGWLLLRGADLAVDGRLCVRGGKLVA